MKWKTLSHLNLRIGGSPVPLKTLRLVDRLGRWRRHRVCTVQEYLSPGLTKIAAWGRLAKDQQGRIGVLVTGAHFGLVKVGGSSHVQSHLFVSLDALSKKAMRKLLIPINYELIQSQDVVLAREREERPYYLASRFSTRFHYSGCPRGGRISLKNRAVFNTREEALKAGYLPDSLCRP
jgi:hypothetical protein